VIATDKDGVPMTIGVDESNEASTFDAKQSNVNSGEVSGMSVAAATAAPKIKGFVAWLLA